jgi:hypothetical protein
MKSKNSCLRISPRRAQTALVAAMVASRVVEEEAAHVLGRVKGDELRKV